MSIPLPPGQGTRYAIDVTPPQLGALHFDLSQGITKEGAFVKGSDEPAEASLKLDLRLARPHKRALIGALHVTVGGGNPAVGRLEVTYAAAFTVRGEIEDEELEQLLQHVGPVVVPSVLYPFVRETVASVTHRAEIGQVATLPLFSFSREQWGEDFEIPSTDTPAPEELLRPLSEDERS